ncbi:hypothetical protein R6Q59_011308 [Mikania micrantha]
MKSMGSVAVLHPQDSLNNHPDNLLSTPSKSHQPIKFHHSYTNSSSPTPNFTDRRRRTPAKRIPNNTNRYAGIDSIKNGEFFAGSVFVASPPPSSVPIPGFFTKGFGSAGRDDPTTELRRILGLSQS